MGDDAGGGEGDGCVDVDGGFAVIENGVDEFVGEECVGAFVAAVVTEGGGEHVGGPPLFFFVLFEDGGLAGKAAGVLFLQGAPLYGGGAEAVGVGVEEAHFVPVVLGALRSFVGAFPPDFDAETGAAVGLKESGFVPEGVVVDVVV